ncbi:type II secretion system protein GspM [Kosakonia sp. BYX6]|uniref:Type II secretion system protein GspM n=1 Tax=Kosakonia calanthes TaxID=3139408 RepID=A0ABZ3BBA9_9ENTR
MKTRVVLQTLRQRVVLPLRQVVLYWRGLTRRERQQVAGMIAVLAIALVWLLLTRPALNTLSHWQQELPRLRSQHAALQKVLAEVGGGPINNGARQESPEQRLAQSIAAAGLTEQHAVQAEGASWVLIFAQPVNAQRLVSWLLSASATTGMAVQQVSIERVDAGETDTRVTASVTLAAPQQRKGE